jgi:uncharacterized protein (DUF433 family)
MEMTMAPTAGRAAQNRFDRVTFDPEVMGDRARIRGMRVTVATIVGQIAEGYSVDDS